MQETTVTVGMAEAKTNFSKLTAGANATGVSITVFKHNKPWVEIRPLAIEKDRSADLPPKTVEAMDEVEQLKADPNRKRFVTVESLFEALGI